jgi:hypothetical protein
MTQCPSCHRPVATARPSCLYCGVALPPELVAAAQAAPPALPGEEPPPASSQAQASARTLLVLDLKRAAPETLGPALGLSSYQAGLLAKRGGFHLHRALEAARAEEEAARLLANDVAVVLVPEEEARVRPLRAIGGEWSEDTLTLRTEEVPAVVRPGELLLVVRGVITREYQPSFKRRRVSTARLEDGYRVHLHRVAEPRPLEIDAANFELGSSFAGSVRLELDAWVEAVGRDVPQDDEFRRLPPALGRAEDEPVGRLAAVGSLRARRAAHGTVRARRGASGAEAARDEPLLILDNVGQFRFYSGWRAAVERRRRDPR